jgi:hypothetical protein
MNKLFKISIIVVISVFFMNYSYSQKLQNTAQYDNDGLYLNILLIKDWTAANKEWIAPKRIKGLPVITTDYNYKRGEMVVPFIIYQTNSLKNGNAYITYSVTYLKPDKSIYSETKNVIGVNHKHPEGMGMFVNAVALGIESNDPLGIYTAIIEVWDRNKNKKVKLNLSFKIAE